jgi:hypothetical protein
MKTARQVAESALDPSRFLSEEIRVRFVDELEKVIEEDRKQVRQSAAREAAEIVHTTGLQYGDYDPDRDGRIVSNACRQAIFTHFNLGDGN